MHKEATCEPTLCVLQLQVASSQMPVNQRRLPTAHAAQDALQEKTGALHVSCTLLSVLFQVLPVSRSYQVELLDGLIHRPFLAAGASS